MLQLTTILFLITGTLWAVLHVLAVKLYLYWTVRWFDMPMHFFGGAVVALALFTLYDIKLVVPKNFLTLKRILPAVFIVAVIWEVYEVLIGVPVEQEGYILDTTIDLVLGLLGGYVGYVVGSRVRKL